jgi:hypothetical protein
VSDVFRKRDPFINIPLFGFQVDNFFSIGSPIGMFLAIRGEEVLVPNCNNMYNIFHPYDPVGYRIEPWINGQYTTMEPQVLPYHGDPTGQRKSRQLMSKLSRKKQTTNLPAEPEEKPLPRYDYCMQPSYSDPRYKVTLKL